MNKTTNKYTPEVRERAVRMVLNGEGQHDSRWSAILSISAKIGCAPQTLNEWVKKVEIDTGQAYRAPLRVVARLAARLAADGIVHTRIAVTFVDIETCVTIAIPPYVACTVMQARAQIVAGGQDQGH